MNTQSRRRNRDVFLKGHDPFVGLPNKANLAWIFTVTELRDRYRYRALGIAWAFVYPLLMMLFFVFLFAVIFPQRVDDDGQAYIIRILAGLLAWLPIADVLNRTTQVLEGNRSLVKQLVFPVEVLPMASVLVAAIPYLPAFVLVFALSAAAGSIGPSLAFLPGLIAFQMLFMLGLSLSLSVVGLVVREVREIIGIILLVGIFCLPILYQPNQLPSFMQFILYVNPASYYVWGWQAVLGAGPANSAQIAFAVSGIAIVSFLLGALVFKKGKRLMGDLL